MAIDNQPSKSALKAFKDLYSKKSVPRNKKLTEKTLRDREKKDHFQFAATDKKMLESVNRTEQTPVTTNAHQSEEQRKSFQALQPGIRRFHGARFSLTWFPFSRVNTACSDRFGYLSGAAVRTASKLPLTAAIRTLLEELGNVMGDPQP